MKPVLEQANFSRGQRALAAVFLLAFVAIQVAVIGSFRALDEANESYDRISRVLTNAANVHREAFRLLHDVDHVGAGTNLDDAILRRSLLKNQLRRLGPRIEGSEVQALLLVSKAAQNFDRRFEEFASTGQLDAGQKAVLANLLEDLVLEAKRLYDKLEIQFFRRLDEARRQRNVVRNGLSVTAFAAVVVGLRLATSVRARFKSTFATAYARLSDEVEQRRSAEMQLAERAEELERYTAALEKANAKLIRADRIKDEFVSVVSHELRTPLTVICGFSRTLADRWHELSEDKRRNMVDSITRQGDRQRRLVDDLLVMSRIMAGEIVTRPEIVGVHRAIRFALDSAGVAQDESVVDCADGVIVHADPDHVHRILINLLGNAVKYGKAPYELRAERGPAYVDLIVRDHGDGVPDDFVGRLFEKFSQADGSMCRTSVGLGMGLAIVDQLVAANGGQISYVPAPGGGAQFVVRLPASTPSSRCEADKISPVPAQPMTAATA